MASKAFTIECENIILREYVFNDWKDICKISQQPHIEEFLPDWNAPKEQRMYWIENYEIPENKQFLKAIADCGNVSDLMLRLGIISKETGDFIGWCCTGIKDELPAPNREIVFGISEDQRNKGYTTEAVRGLVDFLFKKTNIDVLNAIALTTNVGSNKVIQKSGFEYQNTIIIEQKEYNHYKLFRTGD
ncbi:GNAT family N-acetyltransferase [Paenibacillus sp. GCM10028914]|uniref:GNAT family N-acetyltransferase n=1 Tax=Paenibacillus sp. GCM10028914 TaxID=3273416 RepID=UPI00361614A6